MSFIRKVYLPYISRFRDKIQRSIILNLDPFGVNSNLARMSIEPDRELGDDLALGNFKLLLHEVYL